MCFFCFLFEGFVVDLGTRVYCVITHSSSSAAAEVWLFEIMSGSGLYSVIMHELNVGAIFHVAVEGSPLLYATACWVIISRFCGRCCDWYSPSSRNDSAM